MMDIPKLDTKRLRLRAWRLEDFDALAAFLANAELAKYRTGEPIDRYQSWMFMVAQLGQWSLRGHGIFCAALRSTDEPIGYTGLFHPINLEEPEVSYSLFADQHGAGYATEMAAEIVRWAQQDLGLAPPMSFVSHDNHPSRRVAERLGAKIEGEGMFLGQKRLIYRHREMSKTN